MTQQSTGPGIPFALPSVSGTVTGTDIGQYLGFTIRETSGTASVVVVLRDGTVGGIILETISLNPGQSTSDNYPRPGRRVTTSSGIYAVISGTGTFEGTIFQ